MSEIDLIFICSEFGTTDSLPSKEEFNTISDVNDFLWDKYYTNISSYVEEELHNVMNEKKRVPLTFDIGDVSGKRVVLLHTEYLVDIDKKADQVMWHPFVTGGITPIQKFSDHASSIIFNPKYGWEEIVKGNPGLGLKTVGPGPDKIIRTWKIMPSEDYPHSTPIVFGEPVFKNDPCFRTGILKFVKDNNNKDIWSTLSVNYINPLEIVLSELLVKYGIGV